MSLNEELQQKHPFSNTLSDRKLALNERLTNLKEALPGGFNFTIDEEVSNIFNMFFKEHDATPEDEKILGVIETLARHVGNDVNADIIREKREQVATNKSTVGEKNNVNLKVLMSENIRTKIHELANDPQLKDDVYKKYLYSFKNRFDVALDNYRRIRTLEKSTVLDIGTGMGYLPFILARNGHSAVCIDIPNASKVFDRSCDLLGVEKIEFEIKKYKKLMDFKVKFDTINASLICFNNHKTDDLWKKEEWLFFLRDLYENQLSDRGVVHLNFNKENAEPNNFLGCQALHKFFDPFIVAGTNAMITKKQIAGLLNK